MLQAALSRTGISLPEQIVAISHQMGLETRAVAPGELRLTAWHLPFILQLDNGELAIVHVIAPDGMANVWISGSENLNNQFHIDTLISHSVRALIARPARTVPDARVDTYIRPYKENWLYRIILQDKSVYGYVMIASLIANLLGLAGIIFSMQVYDRVIPAQSFNTLYVLFSGVVLAILFDFLIRRARTHIIDGFGKKADLKISDIVYGHALRVKNSARPTSTGSFIAQLRDIEQVRDVLTSTTLAALADLPFYLVFLVLYWWLAGSLVFIPVIALFVLITPGLLLQGRLKKYATTAMREASLRNAMLVESIHGIEDIKMLQAESRFQQQWNYYNAVTGDAQLKLRSISGGLNVWTHSVQALVYAVTIFIGAPLVIAGDLTTGALVGVSILGSRMLAPMGQLSQIAARIQQAGIAKAGLDNLMRLPVDHPEVETRIHCPRINGNYAVKSAVFSYGGDNAIPALQVRQINISSGDHIAVIGRNGAGKSTLLQALAGLMEPVSGEVVLDDLNMQHIDPADIRRDVGLLTQNSRLFYGTIRDNICMGAPFVTDEQIQDVLVMVGADGFIRKLAKGLDHQIQEGGLGLSGGQRQAILLARLLIRNPQVVLLDEPTAAMDEATEHHFIQNFAKWSAGRTVIFATHRMKMLELANRLIVLENGQVALDDEKERGLKMLAAINRVKPSAVKPQAQEGDRS